MNETLYALITSRKFLAAIAGVIIPLLKKVGVELDLEALIMIESVIVAFIIGQGIADHGKEKARIETEPKLILAKSVVEKSEEGTKDKKNENPS